MKSEQLMECTVLTVVVLALLSGLFAMAIILLPTPYQEPNMSKAVESAPLIVEDIYKIHIELPNAGGFTHINTLERYTNSAIQQLRTLPDVTIVEIRYDYSGEKYYRADVYFRKP